MIFIMVGLYIGLIVTTLLCLRRLQRFKTNVKNKNNSKNKSKAEK